MSVIVCVLLGLAYVCVFLWVAIMRGYFCELVICFVGELVGEHACMC